MVVWEERTIARRSVWEAASPPGPEQQTLQQIGWAMRAWVSEQWSVVGPSVQERLPTIGDIIQTMRQTMLQLVVYCTILAMAISATLMSSEVLVSIVSDKMASMGKDVIRQQMAFTYDTAKFRPALD